MESLKLSAKYFAIMFAITAPVVVFVVLAHIFANKTQFDLSFMIALFNDKRYEMTLLKAAGVVVAPIAIIIFLLVAVKPKTKIYGSAKFAKRLNKRLRSKEGVILGTFKGQTIISEGWTPVLLYAPQGSGKTISMAIPNLLTGKNSFVVNDVKRELWEKTSGFRAKFTECYLFAPLHEKSHCWNPFDELKVFKREADKVTMIQKIAAEIYSPGKEKQNASFYQSAERLFVAVALYLHTSNSILTLFECKNFTTPTKVNFQTFLKQIIEHDHGINKTVKGEFRHFTTMKEDNLNTILNFYDKPLSIFLNNDLVKVTSKSDFLLSDLRKRRITIYKGADPSSLPVVQGVFSIFNAIFYSVMTMDEPNTKTEPFGVYDLQDEFTSQGRLDTFMSKIAYLRSYRVRPIIIVQSPSQIKGLYSANEYETIVQSSSDKVIYTPNSSAVAKELSEFMGTYTITQIKKTYQTKSTSRTKDERSRSLMLPQEILALDNKKQIVLSYESNPLLSKKIFSYELEPYKSRLDLQPPIVPYIDNIIVKANDFSFYETKNITIEESSFTNDDLEIDEY